MNTEDLIHDLAGSAAPVRPLAPPMTRALVWLLAVAAIVAVPILLRSNLSVFAARASDPRMAAELALTLATGVAGVIAAFHLTIPGRSHRWAWLPVPLAAGWMALSGLGCWLDWGRPVGRHWHWGQTSYCFTFLLAVGLPLSGMLILTLRRASPLRPQLVALAGALGAAGLAAFVLQFFHPFDVTALDMSWHLAAFVVLIGLFSLSSRRALA